MPFIIYYKGINKRVEFLKYYDGVLYELLISLNKDKSYYDVFDVRNKYLCHLQYIKNED